MRTEKAVPLCASRSASSFNAVWRDAWDARTYREIELGVGANRVRCSGQAVSGGQWSLKGAAHTAMTPFRLAPSPLLSTGMKRAHRFWLTCVYTALVVLLLALSFPETAQWGGAEPMCSSVSFPKIFAEAAITTSTVIGNASAAYYLFRSDEVASGIFLMFNVSALPRRAAAPSLAFEFSNGVVGPYRSGTSRAYLQIYGTATSAEAAALGPLTVVLRNNTWSNSQLIVKDFFPPQSRISVVSNIFAHVKGIRRRLVKLCCVLPLDNVG